MGSNNNPGKVIRECDALLEGKVVKTQEELNRWFIVQLKKLANQTAARKNEHQLLQKKMKGKVVG